MREECFNDLKTSVQMKVVENGEFMGLGNVADNYRKLHHRRPQELNRKGNW